MSSIEILYEDNHLIAINKKPSDIVQADKTKDLALLDEIKKYIKETYNKSGEVYLALVHRIDRPTSGVVLFCKTSKSAARISKDFQNHLIQKKYIALVEGIVEPPQQTLIHNLLKKSVQNKSYISSNPLAKKAILHYQVKTIYDRYSLLEIQLETGRHHQIRCQMAYIGHPIKGDLKYNAKRPNKDKSISLHAWKMTFTHPTTKETICIESPYDRLLIVKN